jgi:hypothetical protein
MLRCKDNQQCLNIFGKRRQNRGNTFRGGNILMIKIAVEKTLSPVKDVLQKNNFEVVDLDFTQQTFIPDVYCYVISGQDKDVMGIADKQADLPVINANGLTEQEVLEQVKQRAGMVSSTRK